jgi:hypothetical protein
MERIGGNNAINRVPATVYDLKVSATDFCSGTTVTFALSNTISGRTYRLYKSGTAVMATMLTKPANPTGVGNTGCGAGTVTISASSPSSGAVIDWYNAVTGGTSLTSGIPYDEFLKINPKEL